MTPQLSAAQLATLKAAVLADPALAALMQLPNSDDDFEAVAVAMNAPASPACVIWRESISVVAVMQNGFDWVRVDNLPVNRARIWEWMTQSGTLNPMLSNVRAGVSACFNQAADATMRTAIFGHFGRPCTRAERLYAGGGSGAGGLGQVSNDSGVGPATAAAWGELTRQEVRAAFEAA